MDRTKMRQRRRAKEADLDIDPLAEFLLPSSLQTGKKKNDRIIFNVQNNDLLSPHHTITMTVIPNQDDVDFIAHQNSSSSSQNINNYTDFSIPTITKGRKRKQDFDQLRGRKHAGDEDIIIFQQNVPDNHHDDHHLESNFMDDDTNYDVEGQDRAMQIANHKINTFKTVPAANYNCTHCPKKFTSPEGLRAHSVVHEDQKLVCVLCTKSFPNQKQFYNHLELVENNCAICNNPDDDDHNQIDEQQQQLSKSRTTCPVCFQQFPLETAVNTHLKDEHAAGGGRAPYGCPFDGCLESFQTFYEWKLHVKDGHPWKCTLCPGQSFSSSESRQIHMRCEHDEPCQVCANCQKSLIR